MDPVISERSIESHSGSTTQTATTVAISETQNQNGDQPRILHLLSPSTLNTLASLQSSSELPHQSTASGSSTVTQLPPIVQQSSQSSISPTQSTGSQTYTTANSTAMILRSTSGLVPRQISVAIQSQQGPSSSSTNGDNNTAGNQSNWASPAPLADALAAQHYFTTRFIHNRESSLGAAIVRQFYRDPFTASDDRPSQASTLSHLYNSIHHQHHPSSPNSQYSRPQFRSKIVCVLDCKHCLKTVCKRGMKAILLADMNVELFSTDAPPYNVQLVFEDYRTRNCACRIRDVACLGCGNVIGYHVTQPCEPCMEACNNGHFWMFHLSEVNYKDRTDVSGQHTMLWAQLPRADRDVEHSGQQELWQISR